VVVVRIGQGGKPKATSRVLARLDTPRRRKLRRDASASRRARLRARIVRALPAHVTLRREPRIRAAFGE